MSRTPTPLPERLRHEAFDVADARELGVGRGRLRGSDLDRRIHGVRSTDTLDSFQATMRAIALALPADCAFSHLTAARLWGMPALPRQPAAARDADEWSPIDVMRASQRPRVERTGCRHHRGLERRAVTEVTGLRVVGRIDTWLDLTTVVSTNAQVVIGDALCAGRVGRPMSPAVLRDLAQHRLDARRNGVPGGRQLRAVMQLVRAGSGSPMESHARLVFLRWGLPEPELNINIYDRYGDWVARPDFLWRSAHVVAEYDGDQHRTDRSRWDYERARRLRLEASGWTYVELSAATLADPELRTELRRRLTALLIP